jgi:hypothetical protein
LRHGSDAGENVGMPARRYLNGSPEMVALDSYLRDGAVGMVIESPGVRP